METAVRRDDLDAVIPSGPMGRRFDGQRVVALFVLLSATAYSIVQLLRFPRWFVDDAYITMRYARNLAEHGQLTWNVGENPVEGYTGVFMPVVLALLHVLGLSLETAARLFTLSAYWLSAALLLAVLTRLRVLPLVRAMAVALFLVAPFVFTHAWAGLETLGFAAAILFAFERFLAWSQGPVGRRKDVLFALSLLFVALIRPEGVAVAGLLGGLALGLTVKTGRGRFFAFLRRSAVWAIAPFAVYTVARVAYYGHLLPNTFYVKTVGPDGLATEPSLPSLREFYWTYCNLLVLAGFVVLLVGLLVGGATGWASVRRLAGSPGVLGLGALAVFVVLLIAVYLQSELVMNYNFRFWTPLYPLVLIGSAFLADVGFRAAAGRGRVIVAPLAIAAVALTAVQVGRQQPYLERDVRFFATTYKQLMADEHVAIGKWLHDVMPPSEWLVSYRDAGAVPFYSQLKAVDMGFLNDEYLAHALPPRKKLIDYMFTFRPGVIVSTGDTFDNDPRLRDYKVVTVARTKAERYRHYVEIVYVRRDLNVPAYPTRSATAPS